MNGSLVGLGGRLMVFFDLLRDMRSRVMINTRIHNQNKLVPEGSMTVDVVVVGVKLTPALHPTDRITMLR